jgi:hypothetical protein
MTPLRKADFAGWWQYSVSLAPHCRDSMVLGPERPHTVVSLTCKTWTSQKRAAWTINQVFTMSHIVGMSITNAFNSSRSITASQENHSTKYHVYEETAFQNNWTWSFDATIPRFNPSKWCSIARVLSYRFPERKANKQCIIMPFDSGVGSLVSVGALRLKYRRADKTAKCDLDAFRQPHHLTRCAHAPDRAIIYVASESCTRTLTCDREG